MLLSLLTGIPAQAADSCSSLSLPTLADDSVTVTMLSMTVIEKSGSYQLTISYKLLNATADKKIDEGAFKLFFLDGSSEPQYGFFGSFFPGDSRERSYTWEYLKGKSPMAVSYNAGFFSNAPSSSKLNWAPPGQTCNLVSPTLQAAAAAKAAADKAAADKAAAAKAAADKAAADKAAADKAAADKIALFAQTIAMNADAAAAATDAANAATDAANIAAEAVDSETSDFFDLLDSAAAKATSGVKTVLDIQKVLKNTEERLIRLESKKAVAESESAKVLKMSSDLSIPLTAQKIYTAAYNSWISAIRAINSSLSQVTSRLELIKNSQNRINKVADEYLARQSVVSKTSVPIKNTTITCTKGKLTKKVTSVKPVCPSGYKKK